jgi:hypothetical protein
MMPCSRSLALIYERIKGEGWLFTHPPFKTAQQPSHLITLLYTKMVDALLIDYQQRCIDCSPTHNLCHFGEKADLIRLTINIYGVETKEALHLQSQ